MPIPSYEDAMLPVLTILADGSARQRRAIADAVADRFALTAEERATMLSTGKAPVYVSRAGWALTYLKQAGLVRSARRGWYELTDRGRRVLASPPARLDAAALERYEEFRAFLGRSRVNGRADDPVPHDGPMVAAPAGDATGTPEDALRAAYATVRAAVEAELLETAKRATPAFFERLVVDLLVRMGYGGNREEAGRAVGRSGDGGIDGVIDEDRLGLDVVYVQAKRWDQPVGRPEVQKFAGALQGQRARKGILITTSSFTRDAVEFVGRIESRIVLVDGVRLSSLMYEYDVGVAPRDTLVIKSVDGDYFEEE